MMQLLLRKYHLLELPLTVSLSRVGKGFFELLLFVVMSKVINSDVLLLHVLDESLLVDMEVLELLQLLNLNLILLLQLLQLPFHLRHFLLLQQNDGIMLLSQTHLFLVSLLLHLVHLHSEQSPLFILLVLYLLGGFG